MKKILITLVVLLVLAFGGLFVLAKMAPVDKLKAEAVAQVKAQTGRDLGFSEAELMFWPNIGVKMKDVTFSNAEWAGEDSMVTLGTMDVRLAVMPLLKKQIEVKKFVLQKPVIYLEKNASGKGNWEFDAKPAEKPRAESSGGVPQDVGFSFSRFEINDGTLAYSDAQTGAAQRLDRINVTLDFPNLGSAMKMAGDFVYRDKKVKLNLGLEKPMDIIAGKSSAGTLDMDTDAMKAAVKGTFATSGMMLHDGQVNANISSLSQLVAWLGGGAAGKMPFEKVSFSSAAHVANDTLKLSNAEMKLDEVEAKGEASLDYGGTRPDINARLSLNKLNLDRFMEGADQSSAAKPASAENEGWDATPIDFSGLKSVNANAVLQTGGFSVKGVDVGASTLTVSLKDGNLKASSSEATLFDGKFSSDLWVNAAPSTPTMAFKFKMEGVQAKPVLATFAGFEKLSGATDANVDVTSSGASQKAIIGNLDGTGAVTFRNGSLTGIDLINIAKMVQSKLDNMGVGEGKTDFVELGGTFTIKNGVAHNSDLRMKGPLLQVTGKGDVDLPKKHVAYRVIPVLTASSAVDNAQGISVPVDIKGPFSAIRIRPDYAGALKNALENPDQIKGAVKNVKEQGKALEQNLKDIKKDPNAAIQNLLGGGGLFGAKKKAAEPLAETPAAAETAPVEAAPAPPVEAAPAAPVESPAAAVEAPAAAVETPAAEEPAPAAGAPVEEEAADTADAPQ